MRWYFENSAQGRSLPALCRNSWAQSRLHALRQALAQKDIALPEEYAATFDARNEPCGYEGMKRLLARKAPPAAVVAGHDTIALGAYRAIAFGQGFWLRPLTKAALRSARKRWRLRRLCRN